MLYGTLLIPSCPGVSNLSIRRCLLQPFHTWMCRIKIGYFHFHTPPRAHSSRATDTDRRRHHLGDFYLTYSLQVHLLLTWSWFIGQFRWVSRASLSPVMATPSPPATAALELICTSSLPASTQVLKHTCMWKKMAPHWARKDSPPPPPQFRHLNVASLSMYCWWLHAGLQRGHHPLRDWIYGCGSPFPISADWLGANLSRQTFAEDKGGCGRRPVSIWNICDSLDHICTLHFSWFKIVLAQSLLRLQILFNPEWTCSL